MSGKRSIAQEEAQAHNWMKMVIRASAAVLKRQSERDVRMPRYVKIQLQYVVAILNDLLREWS